MLWCIKERGLRLLFHRADWGQKPRAAHAVCLASLQDFMVVWEAGEGGCPAHCGEHSRPNIHASPARPGPRVSRPPSPRPCRPLNGIEAATQLSK